MQGIRFIRDLLAALLVWLAVQPAHAEHNLFIIHAPPPMHWTGFYWGGHVGLQWAEIAAQSLADPTGRTKLEERSWSAGLGVGYDREISTVVFGLAADIDLTRADVEKRIRDVPIPDSDLTAEQVLLSTELKWLSTIRGRIGLRINRFVPFATAGIAVARAESSAAAELRDLSDPTADPFFLSASEEDWVAGLTAGGGLEYRLTARDAIGIEYLYVDLPIGDASPVVLGRRTAKDFTSHIVRMLFRYRF
ncbi:MAG TPA: outer membrane beta-barrel protein [Afifellaceae bacterium]|nr:outer membrane beta-barrel protein [Afifellaceae bacterium]